VALENARLESVVSLLHESKRRDAATLRQGQPQGGHGGTANLAPSALCRPCGRGYGIVERTFAESSGEFHHAAILRHIGATGTAREARQDQRNSLDAGHSTLCPPMAENRACH
jgi:hypothetical protein